MNAATLNISRASSPDAATLLAENESLRTQLEHYGRDLSKTVRTLGGTIKRLEKVHHQALLSLARAAEFKDGDTGEHIVRLGVMSEHLGLKLNLDQTFCSMLRYAAPMHDIGKIGTPDSILKKPGKLSSEERKEMERHPEYGARILGGSGVALFDLAAEIALCHHERFDGSGYPRGLKGQEIPISGRVVALIDVFDALTMKRCYRDALSDEVAMGMVKDGAGSHFDPEIADVLIRHVDEFIDLRERVNRGEFGDGI
jgi:putative two-component system response regulator